MSVCMECDEEIDGDTEICPHCGIDAPVAYKWFHDLYSKKVEQAKEAGDLHALSELYFSAYYEAGSLPDLYVLGDMMRELESLYQQLGLHERLIWLYVTDATDEHFHALEQSGRKAYLHAVEINRPDLEYYVMRAFNFFNNRYSETATPNDLVKREAELEKMVENGEFEIFEFPPLSDTMWND